MTDMLRKIRYDWYEGEYLEYYILYDNVHQLNKDLKEIEIMANAKNDYGVRCLPSFYDFILKQLETRGYKICTVFDSTSYVVDDDYNDNNCKIQLKKERVEYIDVDENVDKFKGKEND